MSTLVGHIVIKVQAENPDLEPHIVASALGVVCGGIITFIGLIRCGWIVDFIPLTAISAFMTGSSFNIAAGQIPSVLGTSDLFDTRDATFKVIINTLKHLPDCKLDAAMGLTALFILYVIRYVCGFLAEKHPARAKMYFFISTLRTAFVILFYTMISWLVNRNSRENPKFEILGDVPRGFQHAAVPKLDSTIVSAFVGELPAAVIVLLIEHIAISKSFGRVNNYTIDPSQEVVAIGITNLLGPFLGAYPATGSFSRTAIKSKAGVRTPFAGVITAVVVLLAIYALPAVFFYIPNSSLAGVIIHAVGDLITPPNTIYQFWKVSPLEVLIFFVGVFVTIFSSIENGIYCTICISLAVLLFRVVKAQGQFVGRVKVHSVVGDHLIDTEGKYGALGTSEPQGQSSNGDKYRNIFLPINHNDGSNPEIGVDQPHPGVFIYRFSEGFNYPNANHYLDYLVSTIHRTCRRTNPDSWPRPGDRPWNNPGPRKGQTEEDRSDLPTLRAVILDFSSVNNVDVTSIQNLIDVRNQLDGYASPEPVQWHFAHVNNRWTKRALASAGFGYPTPTPEHGFTRWKPIFSVAEIGGSTSAAAQAEYMANQQRPNSSYPEDVEQGHKRPSSGAPRKSAEADTHGISSQGPSESESNADNELQKELDTSKAYGSSDNTRVALVHGINRPLFHIDLTSALQSAVANVMHRDAENKAAALE